MYVCGPAVSVHRIGRKKTNMAFIALAGVSLLGASAVAAFGGELDSCRPRGTDTQDMSIIMIMTIMIGSLGPPFIGEQPVCARTLTSEVASFLMDIMTMSFPC